MKVTRFILGCLVGLLVATPIAADRLVTADGRILTVRKARKLSDGNYQLVFEHGEIICPERFVKSVEIEGDMSDYTPQNEDEKKKLEQGFVRYRGKWMSTAAYQAELNRETEERRAYVDDLAGHSEFYNAYEKETRHFVVRTNTSRDLLDYYATLLEAYYDLMDKRVGINPTPTLSRTKMRVNIYKNRDDWERNNEAGLGGGVVGYFSFLDESLNFFHDYNDPSFTEWVALHECTHLLTYLIDPQSWPKASAIWMNEGIADFFGSSEIRKDAKGRIEIIPGKLQIDRVLTVQQAIKETELARARAHQSEAESRAARGYIPLEDLFMTNPNSFEAFEYAHAWSFVYFLNNSTKQYEQGFKRFFKDFFTTPKGVPYTWEPFPNKAGTAKIIPPEAVRELLLEALKVTDVGKLENEWLSFISSIKIDGPDALFKRAYTVLQRGEKEHFEQALKDIEAAIAAGFDDARAHWARGLLRAYRAKNGVQAGLNDLRLATELSPLDPTFRFSLAQSLGGYALLVGGFWVRVEGDFKLYGTDEQIEEAKAQLGLACELAPDNEYYRASLQDFLKAYDRRKAEVSSPK